MGGARSAAGGQRTEARGRGGRAAGDRRAGSPLRRAAGRRPRRGSGARSRPGRAAVGEGRSALVILYSPFLLRSRACACCRLAVRLGRTPEKPRQRRFPARREPACRSVVGSAVWELWRFSFLLVYYRSRWAFYLCVGGRVSRLGSLITINIGGGAITCVDTRALCCTSVRAPCFGVHIILLSSTHFFAHLFVCA